MLSVDCRIVNNFWLRGHFTAQRSIKEESIDPLSKFAKWTIIGAMLTHSDFAVEQELVWNAAWSQQLQASENKKIQLLADADAVNNEVRDTLHILKQVENVCSRGL